MYTKKDSCYLINNLISSNKIPDFFFSVFSYTVLGVTNIHHITMTSFDLLYVVMWYLLYCAQCLTEVSSVSVYI
jgi:hypothetical protein